MAEGSAASGPSSSSSSPMVSYLEVDAPDLEAQPEPKEAAWQLSRLPCCCCKRRAAAAARALAGGSARSIVAKAEAAPRGKAKAALPSGGGEDEGYALLETPRRLPSPAAKRLPPAQDQAAAAEEDFFDARSEVDETEAVDISLVDPVDQRTKEVQDRLATLLAIEKRCREGSSAALDNSAVESILKEDAAQLWFCHSPDCPFVIGCLWCEIPEVSVDDAVQAIQSPEQRMSWDGDSFSSFSVMRKHDPTDPVREDVVFTVIPVPNPIRDREILQKRWQIPLREAGGQALLMQSFEDAALQPAHPQRVRAFTHLSGYLLRPLPPEAGKPKRMEVVVISQCDLGGALPGWFQNLARRMAKHRCVAWGGKLQKHCQRSASRGN